MTTKNYEASQRPQQPSLRQMISRSAHRPQRPILMCPKDTPYPIPSTVHPHHHHYTTSTIVTLLTHFSPFKNPSLTASSIPSSSHTRPS